MAAEGVSVFVGDDKKDDVGETEAEIITQEEEDDQLDENYAVDDGVQEGQEDNTLDGDDQPSIETNINKDSTENPNIATNSAGGDAPSDAKGSVKELMDSATDAYKDAKQQLDASQKTVVNWGRRQTQQKQQPQQQQSEIQAEKSGPSASVGVMPPTPTPAEDAATLYTAEDAATLYRAFKGGGCDVGWVLHFLTEHDARHRHLIQQHYKKNYKEDLSDRISSELCMLRTGDLKERIGVDFTVNPTGSFGSSSYIKRAVSLWMLNETERDATIVWQSLQLTSFDKAALTEVICSRTPSQLRSLKDAYFINYGSRLLEDISASTFRFYGYHKELLIVCLDDKAARDEGTNVDRKLAKKDAKQLYKDGEKIWGMNEKTFVDIFTKRNRPHLAAVDAAYDKLYGHSLEVAVENETSGAFKDGLLTLLRCAKNPAKYFAEVLYNSMKGLETLDTTLIRVVVTRAGIDMEDIKKEYKQEYKTSLEDAIHENTCGGYRTFLLLVVETQTQAEETQKMASDTYKDAKQQMEETQKMAMDKYEDTKEETQKMALDTNKDADKVMGTANKKDADKVMGTANKLFVTSNYNNNNAAAARRRPQQKPQGLGQQQSQGKPQQKPQGPGQQQSQGKPQQKPQGLGQQESQEEQQPMESGPTPQPRQKARQLQPPPQQKQSASPTQTQQQPQENKVLHVGPRASSEAAERWNHSQTTRFGMDKIFSIKNSKQGILSLATIGNMFVKKIVDPEMNDQEESDDQDNMNDRKVVDDQPGPHFEEDDDQEDDENPHGAEEDEKAADPDNEDSNEIDNNKDSTENPIEANGEGGNPSSGAKETEKEQTSDKNPIEPNREGGNPSSAAKETEKEQTSDNNNSAAKETEKEQTYDNNNNPAAANNANTTAPPPSQPQTRKPQGQQQPQQKGLIKKESVPPPRELEEQPQVNNASDAPPKKQPQTQPETETQAKSISSVKEKAPCPSSAVPLPTPEDDAATLYRAFKGKGCDVGKVVQILAQRDSTHRNQIAQRYKKNYDEELSDRISSEFSRIRLLGDLKKQVGVDLTVNPTGSFSLFCSDIKRAISLWLLKESERDATIVWQSLQLTSFDKAAVTEVICSRTPSQLRSLKQAYFTKYGSRLLEHISASNFRFSGYHKELLIACLDDKTSRDEGTNVDPKMVEDDAKQLYKDGEMIWGTNEKTFVEIFTRRNRPHLAAVDVAYEKLYGHSLEEAVKKETSGSFEAGLVTLLRCAKNSAKYFAEVLYNSMKGLGTSNAILLRIVVTKAGSVEMEDIKKEYSVAYKISLLDAIHKDTSGHYRTFLVNLVE